MRFARRALLTSLTILVVSTTAFGQTRPVRYYQGTGEPPVVFQPETLPPPVRVVPKGAPGEPTPVLPEAIYETPPIGCHDCCCSDAGGGPSGRFFVSWEYLYWWTRGAQTIPLVTRGPAGSDAALTTAGTALLAGGGEVLDDPRSGARIAAGLWFGRFGLEARAFLLEQIAEGFTINSDGTGNFGIPFASTAGTESALLFATVPPGQTVTGTTSTYASSRLGGAEINPVFNFIDRGNFWVDGWIGYRFIALDEDFQMTTTSTTAAGSTLTFNGLALPGATRTVYDFFGTSNRFNAGQLGSRFQWLAGPILFEFQSRLALGQMHEVVEIRGFTTATSAAQVPNAQTIMRGLFASGSNSGSRSQDTFAMGSELNFNIGYHFTPRLRAFGGYSFLWLSHVVRATEQIDRTVNPTQVPSLSAGPLAGAVRPQPSFNETDYWAQGANIGLLFQF